MGFIAGFFCSNAIDLGVDKLLDGRELTAETKATLKSLDDSVTIISVLTQPAAFIEENQDPKTDIDVKTEDINLGWEKTGDEFGDWKKGRVRQINHRISRNFSTTILGEDDLFTKYTFIEKLTGIALRNRFILPLDDSDKQLDGDKQAAALLKDLKLTEGQALPETYNTDFNMNTDESFSRIFFYGMGSVLLVKQETVSDSEFGPFVVDMPLQDLKTRSRYRPYGARIHFSEDQKVTAIYDYAWKTLVKPGDGCWEEAKMLAKVTALILITAREHLTWTHLIASNTATRESTLKLAPSHPIRRLLTIFTFGATEVNLRAFDKLVPNTSVLHRAVGFKYSAMEKVFDMAYTSCTVYEPFADKKYNPALQKLSDEGKFPYISEGAEYFEIARSLVRNWLAKAGDAATDKQAKAFYEAVKDSSKGQKYELPEMDTEDAMVNLLSQIIFTVTAYHELIGNVIDYAILPSRSGFRLTKKNPSQIDLQSYLLGTVVTGTTSIKMPELMKSFGNFIGVGGAPAWETTVWADFQSKLGSQSKKVKAADAKRAVEFKYFDPERFECSVSV
jgi:hypothetical protein